MSTVRLGRALALLLLVFVAAAAQARAQATAPRPNIVLIYLDDLGYGDVSANGSTTIRTPNMDRIAKEGLRFTSGYATSGTCTPSRFSLLTGKYAWRQAGTGVLPGNAALVIDPARTTLASMLRKAGYHTGVVGKWHLGLGGPGGPDWNTNIAPGPNQVGFAYSFIMAATGDRVPTVYVEDGKVVGLDPADPIRVDYEKKVGDWPTGKENPALLTTQRPSHGHDQTIVNGVSRIGYMTGGKAALWRDQDMGDTFLRKAISYVEAHQREPFFLFYATHEPHVPRVPHERFVGSSGMGPRGDAIMQADWGVGQLLDTLDRLKLADNTIVILTSDNGPVVDDGYVDQAVEKLGAHKPAGPLRGGKYSRFEAGTRVPFFLRWPARVKPGVSDALVSQVDFLGSFAALVRQSIPQGDGPDTGNQLAALLGEDRRGRDHVVEHSGALAIREGRWKYIEPSKGPRMSAQTNTELANDPAPQLYDLSTDLGETKNLAAEQPERVQALAAKLARVKAGQ
ncbi:arylsulfatase [Luteitalea sp. TBR-22]|uniref:sulfatase family protein n=1 Tax=Luteitalea sp. TBR-22 TaxID=2802971 RepID=UPI001EF613EA|nr:arylsulfatase [Luteitalea sp. TBR-22]